MKAEDRCLKFVRWSEADAAYIGYCPDLFPFGGVCHGGEEQVTYEQLTDLVREQIAQLARDGAELPPAITRPMRQAAGV